MISSLKLSLLLSAMAQVESGGNPHAFNYHEQAYGILQVRQMALDDVNRYRFCGYVLHDAFDPGHARDIAAHYLQLWCAASRKYTYEDAARIWNGGPDGWWKLSTLPYWYKVRAELERRGLDSRATLLDSRDTIVEWQPQPTKQSPAEPSVFILVTTGESSSQSDLATSFRFALSASEAKARRSPSPSFTIRPSVSKPAPPPASPPPTSVPAKTPAPAVVFELRWVNTR